MNAAPSSSAGDAGGLDRGTLAIGWVVVVGATMHV